MRLIQIPFSHNCIKVRRALELKQLPFKTLDIAPLNREPVEEASGQRLVPVLEDGDTVIPESNAIERLFMPRARGIRRRLMGAMARKKVRSHFRISADRIDRDEAEVKRLAELAIERLAGRKFLVGDRLTVADIGLASMAAPLWVARPPLRELPAIRELLSWGEVILGREIVSLYQGQKKGTDLFSVEVPR